jgi:hypothetical protein
MRVARRRGERQQHEKRAATTASVTRSRFSSADCLRSWIDAVVSSTTSAPTMS